MVLVYFRKEISLIKQYDLAVIGAGPVGLFAAYFARLHGLKTVILESLNEPGGQPEMLYPLLEARNKVIAERTPPVFAWVPETVE